MFQVMGYELIQVFFGLILSHGHSRNRPDFSLLVFLYYSYFKLVRYARIESLDNNIGVYFIVVESFGDCDLCLIG